MQQERLLLGKNEAARILGLSLRTLDYLIAHSELRVRRIGKRVLISHSELERFANNEEVDAGKSKSSPCRGGGLAP